MDGHLIYAASGRLKLRDKWFRLTADSEWLYYGEAPAVNGELIYKSINEHLNSNLLHVSYTRAESRTVNRHEIMQTIEHLLGVHNFFVWDEDFKKVVEFHNIGVLRTGQIDGQTYNRWS